MKSQKKFVAMSNLGRGPDSVFEDQSSTVLVNQKFDPLPKSSEKRCWGVHYLPPLCQISGPLSTYPLPNKLLNYHGTSAVLLPVHCKQIDMALSTLLLLLWNDLS